MSYKFTSKTWAQIEAAINRVFTAITASRALVSDESGNVTASAVTATELSYLEGAESNLQEQINNIETGSGITSITTDTDTEIDGILKGAEGKVAAAVSLTDFMPGYDLADFETWGADTDYTAGISKVHKVNTDVDYYNYHYYICKTTHNSGSEFSDDNWVKVATFALPVPGVGLVYPYDILTVASWETGTEYEAGNTKKYVDSGGDQFYIQAKEYHTSTGENPFENDTEKWNVLVIIPGGGLENVVEDLTPQLGGNLDTQGNTIVGGTAVDSILKLQSTTVNGTAAAKGLSVLVGNNGATEAITVLNNGNVGIGTVATPCQLKIYSTSLGFKPVLWVSDQNSTLGGALYFEWRGGAVNNKIHAFVADSFGFSIIRINDAGSGYGSSYIPDFLINTSGNIGIQTEYATNALSFGGLVARTIWMQRHTTANTAGNSLTLQAGGATVAATDKNGGTLILAGALATGTGFSYISAQTSPRGTTGTSDNTLVEQLTIGNTARLALAAGSATANTAPLKFVSGALLATPEEGTIEYYNGEFYLTIA